MADVQVHHSSMAVDTHGVQTPALGVSAVAAHDDNTGAGGGNKVAEVDTHEYANDDVRPLSFHARNSQPYAPRSHSGSRGD